MAAPDQVVIRGNAEALSQAARLLGRRRVAGGVRAFVIPADNAQYSEGIDSGAIAALHGAGFVICAPGTPEPAFVAPETSLCHPPGELKSVIEAAAGNL